MKAQGDTLKRFGSDGEVEEVVRKFESCEFGPDEFKHPEHLSVALVYGLRFGEGEALRRTRAGILRFLAHHHIEASSVYHETITVFWLRRVRAFAEGRDRARLSLAALANEMLKACGDSRFVFEYYSKDVLDSPAARASLVEPDLKPLDF